MHFDELAKIVVPEDMPIHQRLFAPRALACLLAMRPIVPPRRGTTRWAQMALDRYKTLYPLTYKLFNPIILIVILQIALVLIKWWRENRTENLIVMERAYLEWSVENFPR
jgi:hypothetical protein